MLQALLRRTIEMINRARRLAENGIVPADVVDRHLDSIKGFCTSTQQLMRRPRKSTP